MLASVTYRLGSRLSDVTRTLNATENVQHQLVGALRYTPGGRGFDSQ
jgi:hypothetical protein